MTATQTTLQHAIDNTNGAQTMHAFSNVTLFTKPEAQPKTKKGLELGIMTFAMHLAPADISGFEVCPMRTAGCTAACLNTAGRGRFDSVQLARLNRTLFYFNDRPKFMRQLVREIERAIQYASKRGFTPAFRLNATSDIPWHRVPCEYRGVQYASVMHAFPDVQFYDYTKVYKRITRETLPANYHLTFSLAENNDKHALAVLKANGNVAAVFRDKQTVQRAIDSGYFGFPVISGDESDLPRSSKLGSGVERA